MNQLREAFATLSDVLVEELDAVRSDAARRWELAEAHLNKHAQSLRVLRAELALLRDEMQTSGARLRENEEATDAATKACQQMASELATLASAQTHAQTLVQQERAEAAVAGSTVEEKLRMASEALQVQLAQQYAPSPAAVLLRCRWCFPPDSHTSPAPTIQNTEQPRNNPPAARRQTRRSLRSTKT